MKYLILLSLVAFVNCQLSDTTTTAKTFCNTTECLAGTSIACQYTISTAPKCATGAILDLDKAALVKRHNEIRQKFVSDIWNTTFPAPTNLYELTWSDELAQMALYNAKRCEMLHDVCRNTNNFPSSGQSLVSSSSSSAITNSITPGFINYIWNEYKLASANFNKAKSDKTTKVGCAAVTYQESSHIKGRYKIVMACNYDYINMPYSRDYIAEAVVIQCKTKSSTYPALCTS